MDRDKTAVKVTHYDMYCTKREGGERERVQEKKRKRQERRVLEGIERERVAHITNTTKNQMCTTDTGRGIPEEAASDEYTHTHTVYPNHTLCIL